MRRQRPMRARSRAIAQTRVRRGCMARSKTMAVMVVRTSMQGRATLCQRQPPVKNKRRSHRWSGDHHCLVLATMRRFRCGCQCELCRPRGSHRCRLRQFCGHWRQRGRRCVGAANLKKMKRAVSMTASPRAGSRTTQSCCTPCDRSKCTRPG